MLSPLFRRCGVVVTASLLLAACQDEAARRETTGVAVGSLVITNAVIPAPVTAGDTRAALYLTIHNGGTDVDTLLSLSSPIADSVTLHTMRRDGGMMRMTPLGPLPIPPGESTVLEPGRRHGMFEGLRRRIDVGDTVQVTLRFAGSGSGEISVPVVAYDRVSQR